MKLKEVVTKNSDLCIAVLGFATMYFSDRRWPWIGSTYSWVTSAKMETLLITNISLLGAFLGFIIATLAIIAAALESDDFVRLRSSGLAVKMIRRFSRLIWATVVALGSNIVAVICLKTTPDFFVIFILAVTVGWFWNFVGCMRIFEAVLKARFRMDESTSGHPTESSAR